MQVMIGVLDVKHAVRKKYALECVKNARPREPSRRSYLSRHDRQDRWYKSDYPKDAVATTTSMMGGAVEVITMRAVGAMKAGAMAAAMGTTPPRATTEGETSAAPTAPAAAAT